MMCRRDRRRCNGLIIMNIRTRDYHITIHNIGDVIRLRGGNDSCGCFRSIAGGDCSGIKILLSVTRAAIVINNVVLIERGGIGGGSIWEAAIINYNSFLVAAAAALVVRRRSSATSFCWRQAVAVAAAVALVERW